MFYFVVWFIFRMQRKSQSRRIEFKLYQGTLEEMYKKKLV